MPDTATVALRRLQEDLEDGRFAATWTERVIFGTRFESRLDLPTFRHLNQEAFTLFEAALNIGRAQQELPPERIDQLLSRGRDLVAEYERAAGLAQP